MWPANSPPPKFRNNQENSQKLMKVVDELSSKDEFTFKRLGLGRNAIAQLIRKHMDERRRAEADLRQNKLLTSGTSDSSTDLTDNDEVENSTAVAPPSSKRSKQKADSDDCKGEEFVSLSDYFIRILKLYFQTCFKIKCPL